MDAKIRLRLAVEPDLLAINTVIEAAVMSWQLPERVKRLSLPSYRYDAADLLSLVIWVAEDEAGSTVGLAGCEPADPADTPERCAGLLLHGLYVLPTCHGQGLGRRLLQYTEQYAVRQGYVGVLVKAQTAAVGFFSKQGYEPLPVEDSVRHYSHRLWKNTEK